MELLDYILHFGDVLSPVDHRRLLEICRGVDFPDYKAGNDKDSMYDLHANRGEILLSPDDGELYDLTHRVMLKLMPKIYNGYSEINPPNPPLFDKYSGYWLCKYPEGGYLSYHTDADADAGSVTVSYTINYDYEGGDVSFWNGKHTIMPRENSAHVYPSNFLYPHRVNPVTKGERYSIIVWFSYQKGEQWLI